MGEKKVIKKIESSTGSIEMPELNLGELQIVKQMLEQSSFKGSDAELIYNFTQKVNKMMELQSQGQANGVMTLPDGVIPDGAQV
jgi:hypothetical protein